jgi:hypothetical protein
MRAKTILAFALFLSVRAASQDALAQARFMRPSLSVFSMESLRGALLGSLPLALSRNSLSSEMFAESPSDHVETAEWFFCAAQFRLLSDVPSTELVLTCINYSYMT